MKTRAGRRKALKIDDAPSESVEGEIPTKSVEGDIPTMKPATMHASPKRRGRKPKCVMAEALAGNLPPQNMADVAGPKTANQPTDNIENGLDVKSKALVPTRKPLPP